MQIRHHLPALAPALACASLLVWCTPIFAAPSTGSGPETVSAAPASFKPHYPAWARVVAKATVTIRTAATGVVGQLQVLPGTRVHAGELLATLGGADFTSRLRTAKSELIAARHDLKITRQKFPHFSTAKDIADARAAFITAQAELTRIKAAGRITAPCDGLVVTRNAASGDRLAAGRRLLTLQPTDTLWLEAAYYGNAIQRIHPGMRGKFTPSAGGAAIPVKVVTRFTAMSADGGDTVWLMATEPSPGWRNGQYGSLLLTGHIRRQVAVPTRALIMNQGHWWVLLASGHGLTPREVIPGPARGWRTFIAQGVNAGDKVVVDDAYLLFHRNIANSYLPPD